MTRSTFFSFALGFLLVASTLVTLGSFSASTPFTPRAAYGVEEAVVLDQFGTTDSDFAYGVAADSTGVYVVGYTDGALEGENAGSSDAFIRKYNTDGDVLWTDQFGIENFTQAHAVAADSTGVYVAGFTIRDFSSNVDGDAFIVKYVISVDPVAATQELIRDIENAGLAKNVENALVAPLKNIEEMLTDDNPNNDKAACGKLGAFLNMLSAHEAAGNIDSGLAQDFNEAAGQIMTSLGCS